MEADLAVTLTVGQLRELVRVELREELAKLPIGGAKEVMNLEEVAALLDRHPRTIKELIDTKGLPVRYISDREPRFVRADVLAWLLALPRAKRGKEAA